MKKGIFSRLGAYVKDNNVTFSFEVRNINDVPLICVFEKTTKKLIKKYELDDSYRVGRIYCVEIDDIDICNSCYLYQINEKYVLDPYATSIVGRQQWNDKNRAADMMLVYAGIDDLNDNWECEEVNIKPQDMVVYQANMRGFTMQHGLSENLAGNYKGFLKRLDYIKNLGFTSVELMPVYDFEEIFYDRKQVVDKTGKIDYEISLKDKVNYWGYGEASYFAPKASYFGNDPVSGLRDFISQIHLNGLELILDFSFTEKSSDDLIISVLEFYVLNYKIDGIRVIGGNCPMDRLAFSPVLADTKIFYESVQGDILSNEKHKHLFIYDDSFMYVLRQMINHMDGSLVQFANHNRRQNEKYGFVNYCAINNGFTLMDSFSYGEKHNLDNGEENRDGNNINYSANYGFEGATRNKAILAKRNLQARNSLFATILSQGIPMVVSGDERCNSAFGNNNPYCQDNEIGWINFSKRKDSTELLDFTKLLIDFRRQHSCIRQEKAFSMNDYKHVGLPDISYHGSSPWLMGIGEEQKAFGILYCGEYSSEKEEVYLCYNFSYEEVTLALPRLASGKRWRKAIDTADLDFNSSPKPIDNQQSIIIGPESCIALVGIEV